MHEGRGVRGYLCPRTPASLLPMRLYRSVAHMGEGMPLIDQAHVRRHDAAACLAAAAPMTPQPRACQQLCSAVTLWWSACVVRVWG